MDLPVKLQSLFKLDSQHFLSCSGKDYHQIFKPHHQKEASDIFQIILNRIGELSSKAQGLKSIITSSIKFIGSDQRIYIKVSDKKILGFVKVGEKNLFYRDFGQTGGVKQLKPTCILDIYVHESCQRSGIGKEIFEKFLRVQKKLPEKLGYDRPSEKLISFLKKHYSLAKFIPQNNNFVIYDRYFDKSRPKQFNNRQVGGKYEQAQKECIDNDSFRKINSEEDPKKGTWHQRQFTKQMKDRNSLDNSKKQMNDIGNTGNIDILGSNQKNMSSQEFPLSFGNKPGQKLGFRTTSNAYGSYYKR